MVLINDNNKEILNLFKENIRGNDRDMQQENNGLFSRIDEVNKVFIERRTVDITICKLNEGIYHSNVHFNCIRKTGFNYFLRHNYILHCEIRSRIKDNTVC